jgi:uncharacterized iron-regulated membrane protein
MSDIVAPQLDTVQIPAAPGRAGVWDRLLRQPQTVWLRKALFQVHLWTGIGVGLYICTASITGSAIVFRRELNRALRPVPPVSAAGPRLSEDEIKAAAKREFPRFKVDRVEMPARADRPAEVYMSAGRRVRQSRWTDPYTGKDLGSGDDEVKSVIWLVDLHDNLLGGQTGKFINGLGGFLLAILCLTGIVIWWPGIASWSRGLILHRGVNWKRFNFDLHSVIGFWTLVALLMWAITGAYLGYPDPFQRLVELTRGSSDPAYGLTWGDDTLAWFARLHFGRTFGRTLEALWVIVGLCPTVLFVTGAIMWWNRVLRDRF